MSNTLKCTYIRKHKHTDTLRLFSTLTAIVEEEWSRDGSSARLFLLTSFTSDAVFFVFLFLEGSGQSPVVFYSVTTGINEDAAKDMANARLQLCMFAITITMETKDHRQCREIAGRGG